MNKIEFKAKLIEFVLKTLKNETASDAQIEAATTLAVLIVKDW